ncbi:MAG: radical SAM protein [Endomicrobiaceae bacterium]|nr:radical SAM protein [Endomicrobiaceae bacterium]
MEQKKQHIKSLKHLIAQKKYDDALRLSCQISEYENDLEYMMEMGQLLKATSDLPGALKWFEKVILIDKNNIYAVKGKVECLKKSTNYREIINFINFFEYEEQIKIIVDVADISINLGDIIYLNELFEYVEKYFIKDKTDIFVSILLKLSDKIGECVNSNDETTLITMLNNYMQTLSAEDKNIIIINSAFSYLSNKKIDSSLKWIDKIIPAPSVKNQFTDLVIKILTEIKKNHDEIDELKEYLNNLHEKIDNQKIKNMIVNETKLLKHCFVKTNMRTLLAKKEYTDATILLNQISDVCDPDTDVEFLLLKGQLLNGISNFTGALEYFEKVLKLDKENMIAIEGMLESLKNTKRYMDTMKFIGFFDPSKQIQILEEISTVSLNYNDINALNVILLYVEKHINNDKIKLLSYILLKIADKVPQSDNNKSIDEFINILNLNIEILPEESQNIIREKIGLYYKHKNDITGALKYFISITKKPEIESKIVSHIIQLLRDSIIFENQAPDIINYLNVIYENLQSDKLKNIILGEIEILQCKTVLKSKPVKMNVILTTRCNLNCIMCTVCKNEYTIDENYLRIIKEYLPYLESVLWQGGEVFLYSNFQELITLAHKNGVKQGFVTNALLLNKELIEMIGEYNIELSISIDSVHKENYEKIRCGAKFSKLIDVLTQLHNYKLQKKDIVYGMAVVVMSLNYDEIDDIVKFAISYGFKVVYFQRYVLNKNVLNGTLMLTDEQKIKVLKKIKQLKNDTTITKQVEISTNIGDDLLISNNIDVATENIEVNSSDNNTDAEKTHLSNNSNMTVDTKSDFIVNHSEKIKNRLFCIAPWKTLFLDFNMMGKCSCYCDSFKTSKELDDIWNCQALVKYRESIINNKLYKCCDSFCRNAGDDGVEIRKLGWK